MRSDTTTPKWLRAGLAAVLPLLACREERPPAPEAPPAQVASPAGGETDGEAPMLDPGTMAFVLTHAGPRGTFVDTHKPDGVPEEARGMVRVTLLGGPSPRPDEVFVTNLRRPEPDGRYKLTTVARDMFEELALGQGLSSQVQLPEGIQAPAVAVKPSGDIIVYKTDWCGVCKKLIAYLDRKGVAYQAKDVEKDAAAAAELKAKSQAAGVKTGSVPVIDVRGELMVGFDRGRLEKLLGS